MTDSESRTVTRAQLAAALEAMWPHHTEGVGSVPPSPTDHTYEVWEPFLPGSPNSIADAIFARLPAGVGGDREALLNRQIDEFMGWLFRDGGLEPPRREYDLVDQRLRTFLLSAALSRPDALVEAALTSEDEIAHGEGWDDVRKRGLGVCAYCDDEWPCRTQRGIDRLRAALADHP